MLGCCVHYYSMWDGGNQWAAGCSYLSFFRHVAKLDLPIYKKWQHYESAAIHGGPRAMHAKFCMVSDRPEFIHRDANNRPHCETGPFCRWRDGWSLYYWHGVAVSRQIIEAPQTLTAEQIDAETNAEVRRIMIERMGVEKYMRAVSAEFIDVDTHTHNGFRALARTKHGMYLVCTCPSTGRMYHMEVDPQVRTCEQAATYLDGPALAGLRQIGAT